MGAAPSVSVRSRMRASWAPAARAGGGEGAERRDGEGEEGEVEALDPVGGLADDLVAHRRREALLVGDAGDAKAHGTVADVVGHGAVGGRGAGGARPARAAEGGAGGGVGGPAGRLGARVLLGELAAERGEGGGTCRGRRGARGGGRRRDRTGGAGDEGAQRREQAGHGHRMLTTRVTRPCFGLPSGPGDW
jgi:hypothetical protein